MPPQLPSMANFLAGLPYLESATCCAAKGGWVNVSRWTVSGPKGGLKGVKIG